MKTKVFDCWVVYPKENARNLSARNITLLDFAPIISTEDEVVVQATITIAPKKELKTKPAIKAKPEGKL